MRISQKTIDEIFSMAIIEEVISDFVALKKTGANYKGLSPFNDEKTPSFVVSPSKEIWKDFSSGRGGNLISFLMEHEQYTYPEALLFLAKKYNITVEYIDLDPKDKQKETEREATLLVLKFVAMVFSKNLETSNNQAMIYLRSRGFSDSTIKDFAVGYCPSRDKKLLQETKKAGYNLDYLKKLRIINEKEQNRFSARLIFPIHSMSGQVLGFGGRVLDDKTKSVKYLNSDSSEIYQKSKVLYGLHLAKKYIKSTDTCYIVEGYTDVMALHQVGIKNTVSNCGTALTNEQIRLIKRFTNNIVILFDSDLAGINATLKAIDSILVQNMTPKVLQLPAGEDPASFVKLKSKEAIDLYIQQNTFDFIQFKYRLNENQDTANLIELTKGILSSVALIEDNISQTFHIRYASKLLSVKEDDLLSSLNKIKLEKSALLNKNKTSLKNSPKEVSGINFNKIKKEFLEEFQLIRLLIHHGSSIILNSQYKTRVSEFIVRELDQDSIKFQVPIFNIIFSDVKSNSKTPNFITKDYFLTHKNIQIKNLSAYVVGEQHFLGNWGDKDIIVLEEKDILMKVVKESILRFKLKRVKQMVQESLISLKNTSQDNDEGKLLQRFTGLNKLEKKIQQELGRLV